MCVLGKAWGQEGSERITQEGMVNSDVVLLFFFFLSFVSFFFKIFIGV